MVKCRSNALRQLILFSYMRANKDIEWIVSGRSCSMQQPAAKGSRTCLISCCFQGSGRRVCLCTTQSVGRASATWSEGHPYTPPHSIACLALVCSYGKPAQRMLVMTEAHAWGAERVEEPWGKERACCRLSARQPFCTAAQAARRSPDCCVSHHIWRRNQLKEDDANCSVYPVADEL